MITTLPADALVPDGATPSSGTVLTPSFSSYRSFRIIIEQMKKNDGTSSVEWWASMG